MKSVISLAAHLYLVVYIIALLVAVFVKRDNPESFCRVQWLYSQLNLYQKVIFMVKWPFYIWMGMLEGLINAISRK